MAEVSNATKIQRLFLQIKKAEIENAKTMKYSESEMVKRLTKAILNAAGSMEDADEDTK